LVENFICYFGRNIRWKISSFELPFWTVKTVSPEIFLAKSFRSNFFGQNKKKYKNRPNESDLMTIMLPHPARAGVVKIFDDYYVFFQ
jgi:hypothetical protein